MIKAVSFDVGSTLLYPMPPVPDAFISVSAAHGIILDEDEVWANYEKVEQFYEDRYLSDGDFWCDPEGCKDFWQAYYQEYCKLMNVGVKAREIVLDMLEAYSTGRGWAVYEDVVPALTAIRGAGVRIAVISNWGPELPVILHDVGLASYCELVSASSMLGCRKPGVEIFARTYADMGIKPQEVIHVGDLPEADGEGARNAGAKPLIIDRHGMISECAFTVIGNLRQISDYL